MKGLRRYLNKLLLPNV